MPAWSWQVCSVNAGRSLSLSTHTVNWVSRSSTLTLQITEAAAEAEARWLGACLEGQG